MDLSDLMNGNNESKNKYESADTITTVITSIPTQIDTITSENESSQQKQSGMEWIHCNAALSVYGQRKERKRETEARETRKKYQRKVKKMLKFVKEFNRNKKRKANAKYSKKKKRKKMNKKK